ncbi:MAG TPA: CocE/NonD family hydrolase, partial [Pseudonocardiaceae bacterium]|nr:CocE/NonD family hydrolase [Pseudonocardiaceae bacterium]
MMGISWGGFNALQLAARRPPGLGAIVTACSTDDRYADDVHYMGGCLLSDNLSWAAHMFAYNSCPPDPAVAGERWRQMWHERLTGSGLWLEDWLHHQRRDSFWRHGSVCENFADIDIPVYAVSGWADGYTNSVLRLLAELDVPRKGLIGPWAHTYPHLGRPGPAIGFLQEIVRWWDRWLKGVENNIMDEPMLRTWMQDSVPPCTAYEQRPGRWVGDPCWPSPRVRECVHPLAPRRIAQPGEHVEPGELTIRSPLSVGQYAGKWCSYNVPPDLPFDQREEDGGSLVFDTGPLPERCEILGMPVVELAFASSAPVAMIAVRLSDVAPDGRATRISYGLLNLTHHKGHAEPEYLVPGRRYHATVQLNAMAQALPPGHRLRLAMSTSYWPLAWPPPEPVLLSVFIPDTCLRLPVRPAGKDDGVSLQPFDEPEGAPPIPVTQLSSGEQRWRVSRDLHTHRSTLEVVRDLGLLRFDDIGLAAQERAVEHYSWRGDDMSSARGEAHWTMSFARADWQVQTSTRTTLACTPTDFQLHASLDAYEGGQRVHTATWQREIPRDHV